MTETNDIAAIRQRADALEALNWRDEDFDAYRYLPQTHDDRAALLAHVDELTRKLAAAEAALREQKTVLGVFAGIAERYHEHVKTTPEPFEAWFMRVIEFPLLLDECEAAGEALADAASALAGNGGA